MAIQISVLLTPPPFPPLSLLGYHGQVFVEYVVLSGVNDGLDQARELGALLKVACQVPHEILLPTHHPTPMLSCLDLHWIQISVRSMLGYINIGFLDTGL